MKAVSNIQTALGQDRDWVTRLPCALGIRRLRCQIGVGVLFCLSHSVLKCSAIHFDSVPFCYLISIVCSVMKMGGKHITHLYKNHLADPCAGNDKLQLKKIHLKLLIKWWIISVIFRFYIIHLQFFKNPLLSNNPGGKITLLLQVCCTPVQICFYFSLKFLLWLKYLITLDFSDVIFEL